MSNYLLDTGILIRHLRGHKPTVKFLRNLGSLGRFGISTITRLEIHAGMHPEEKAITRKLLSRFNAFGIDNRVADKAGEYLYQSRKKGISLSIPDAIIGATSVCHRLTLVTLNAKDFQFIPGIQLYPFSDFLF